MKYDMRYISAIIFALIPSSALSKSTQVRISLTVPVICNVKVNDIKVNSKITVKELCNTASGSRVLVKHDQDIGDQALFTYGGRTSVASPLGVTEVYTSKGATNVQRLFEISGISDAEAQTVSLIILPN